MGPLQLNTKRLQISKASATIVAVVGVSSFITVFSLVSIRALLIQRAYQGRIIKAKTAARDQLDTNITAVTSLKSKYETFASQSINVLGGNATSPGERDGDNARLVLDALPSKYDFPALTSSLEMLMKDGKFSLQSISGTDDEIAQAANATAAGKPIPIPMPFDIVINNDYKSAQSFVSLLDSWIRPVQINTLSLGGTNKQLQITVSANTYYQPSKGLNITTKEVK